MFLSILKKYSNYKNRLFRWHRACAFSSYLAEFSLPTNIRIRANTKFPHRQRAALTGSNEYSIPIEFKENNFQVNKQHMLAICTRALYRYWDLSSFIQFVEYYQIAGATKFYFYIDSITIDMQRIVDIYRKSSSGNINNDELKFNHNSLTFIGIEIELIDWHRFDDNPQLFSMNHTVNNTGLYVSGHIESNNDCLYRSRHSIDYVGMIDFDEFIVPIKYNRLIDWLRSIDEYIRYDDYAGVGFQQHEHYLTRYDAGWRKEKSTVCEKKLF